MNRLIKDLVVSLAPALPYLAIAGKKLSEEIGQAIGKGVMGKAKKIWEILHYKIELNPPALDAAMKVAENPEDQDAQKYLGIELKKILDKDADLVKELSDFIQNKKIGQQINNYAPIEKQINIRADKIGKIEI